jgi:hypothetical protein
MVSVQDNTNSLFSMWVTAPTLKTVSSKLLSTCITQPFTSGLNVNQVNKQAANGQIFLA